MVYRMGFLCADMVKTTVQHKGFKLFKNHLGSLIVPIKIWSGMETKYSYILQIIPL